MTSRVVTSRDNVDAHVVALVQAYLDADYRWEQVGEWPHLRIGEAAPDIDAAFPEAACFGFLAAWNPQSTPRPDVQNRAADEVLRLQLVESGVTCRPGFSSACDRSWREPSWLATDMAPGPLDALAQRFGQLGTLWWRRGEAVRLRIYVRQPDAVAEHPFIDWVPPTASLD